MASVFNADDHDLPFFGSQVRPDPRLSSGGLSDAHVPGRHLNALLNAEAAAGVAIDAAAVAKHTRAAFFSYSGPLALPLGRTTSGGRLGAFDPHNVREGFHALCALAQFRDSARARELAAASIAAIFTTWDPDSGWDRDRIERDHGLEFQPTETFIVGLARAIGPLVKYFRATGYGPALELAIVLTEKATSEFFLADGSYDARRFGLHTHSTTCVMSSLAQLADLTSDAVLMERVKAFYDHGLWRIRDALGWVMENSGDKNLHAPDRGEANNTGDILETALILGRWGYPAAYHDAERILRGHLLPSQLRDTAFIVDPPNPARADGLRDLAARHRGAFGFPAPYGHEPLGIERVSFNMDIVGGAVGSLCEAYREATRVRPGGPLGQPALRSRDRGDQDRVDLHPWDADDHDQAAGTALRPPAALGTLGKRHGRRNVRSAPGHPRLSLCAAAAAPQTNSSVVCAPAAGAGSRAPSPRHPRPAAGRRRDGDGLFRRRPDVLRSNRLTSR